MADFVSAVTNQGAVSNARLIEVANPAQKPEVKAPELSEGARAALQKIGEMQSNYKAEIENQKEIKSVDVKDVANAQKSGNTLVETAELMQAQMDASRRVQNQLTRFVMVSSVSTSFGRNLNMFLRGQ